MADSANTNAVLADPMPFGGSELLAGGFEIADPIQSQVIYANSSGLLMSPRITPSKENNYER